jgi:DNA-binding NarL/FixJ family response regulator
MKFVLVDDHFLIREALRGALKEIEPASNVLEASRWGEASRLIDEHPDAALVLLDLVLPDHDGFTALEQTRKRHPGIPVVILSGKCERDSVIKALDLGAVGFIPKSGERKVMLGAIRLVLSGGVYIPPEILAEVSPSPPARGRAKTGSPADFGLTQRQVDVLALMARGKSNKVICRTLKLAEPTVRNHVTAILRSLRASNRTEAVVMAGELGWKLPKVEDDSVLGLVAPSKAVDDRQRRGRPGQAGR